MQYNDFMLAAKGEFLPINLNEAKKRGWDELDIVIISGDAYVDHPSFGAAVIGRVLEAAGFRVGIIPQPNINNPQDFLVLGRPRLFFGIAPGNVDSMLLHFTALKRVRNDDPYTPGGVMKNRPKRAAIAYTAAVRHACKGVPVVLGGIECSTRRFTHYDYWDDKLRRPILLDAKADLLVFGMGERQIIEIATRLRKKEKIEDLTDIAGTVHIAKDRPKNAIELPSYEDCLRSKDIFAQQFRSIENNPHASFYEPSQNRFVVQNATQVQLPTNELDAVYELPFMRDEHPTHKAAGGVPALEMVANSVVSHRGCTAVCSFCSISVHQGRTLSFRSKESVLREVSTITKSPHFHGTISDVGGPSANMYGMECELGGCSNPRCVGKEVCQHFKTDHNAYIDLLESVAAVNGVKHVFVGSGMRYDLLLREDEKNFERIISRFVSGQLKVAPEHAAVRVLHLMGKPPWRQYLKFREKFYKLAARLGKKLHLIPYLITSHPGTTLDDERFLLNELERLGFVPDQVQDFIPLPMTRSSVMFYAGVDPMTGESVYAATTREEKERHFAVLRPKVKKYEGMRKSLVKNRQKDNKNRKSDNDRGRGRGAKR